jgi:hypothetical protein
LLEVGKCLLPDLFLGHGISNAGAQALWTHSPVGKRSRRCGERLVHCNISRKRHLGAASWASCPRRRASQLV